MRKLVSAILFVTLLTAVLAAGLQSPTDVSKAGFETERLALIPVRMQAFVERGTISGAVTLVARHGVIASLEAVGYQDIETKKAMRTDTIFQVRSMTKSVTAAAVMILLEDGLLRLADPVEKYVSEFKTISPNAPVTIRHLLTHTSGMPADVQEKLWPKLREQKSIADIVALLAHEPLEFEPGTKYLYSDLGFTTLGRVIEVASGQPYQRFIDEKIFRPLGMKDTSLLPPLDKYDRIASVYEFKDGRLQKSSRYDISSVKSLRFPGPSWSMFSTATDLFAFYQMMLHGGNLNGRRILSRASVETMTRVQTGDLLGRFGTADYGLGFNVVRNPKVLRLQSTGSFGHGGRLSTYGWVDPKNDLVGIFLTQRVPLEWPAPLHIEERDTFMAMAAGAMVD